jgi:hypothetical protein
MGTISKKKWCPRGDLNSHSRKNRILNPARLPIPPQGLFRSLSPVKIGAAQTPHMLSRDCSQIALTTLVVSSKTDYNRF